MASLLPSSVSKDSFLLSSNSLLISPGKSVRTTGIYGSPLKWEKTEDTRLRFLGSVKTIPVLRLEASRETLTSTQEVSISKKMESVEEIDSRPDLFNQIQHRFLSFKRHKYLEKSDHFQKLAKGQTPKFMVIACADSRVCPSSILGFEPGEAFMVRNVANLVPPFENGPSETNAALEFAVNSLEVENLFVVGHSCCGGIRALMSMQDEVDSSSFIRNWVVIGKHARSSTREAAVNLSFEQQCRHCEKESVNRSLVNLLTYPWIEERARKGLLSIHGGYYDFVNCTFEKWTLDYKGSNVEDDKYAIKDRAFWS